MKLLIPAIFVFSLVIVPSIGAAQTAALVVQPKGGDTSFTSAKPKESKVDSGQGTETALKAATGYLIDADLPASVRDEMLAVLRKHASESRWSGRSNTTIFGVAVKHMPAGTIRQQADPVMLEMTHMLAIQEIMKAKCLLDRYAGTGLTDATTLEQAVMEVAGTLTVSGKASGLLHGAAVRGDFAIAYVTVEEQSLLTQLLQEAELDKVRTAYRKVMHRQVTRFMQRADWQDALLLWHHLRQRKLVSQQLCLDAALCFKALGRNEDAVRVLSEAVDAFGKQATAEFLEQAGDIALGIQTESAQKLAAKAYQAASDRLKETVSQSQPRGENKPK